LELLEAYQVSPESASAFAKQGKLEQKILTESEQGASE